MAGEFDMGRMQEEAIRRAKEMQSRAKIPPPFRRPSRPAEASQEEPEAATAEAPSKKQENTAREQPPIPQPNPPEAIVPAQNGLLEALFQDKERTIILALLILLGSEEGNHELMFALLFLLM